MLRVADVTGSVKSPPGGETPEDLHDAQGGGRHRICEVAAGRRDRADDSDGALPFRTPEALHTSAALIERREPCTEVSRVSSIGRHLGKTARDLAKRFSPA